MDDGPKFLCTSIGRHGNHWFTVVVNAGGPITEIAVTPLAGRSCTAIVVLCLAHCPAYRFTFDTRYLQLIDVRRLHFYRQLIYLIVVFVVGTLILVSTSCPVNSDYCNNNSRFIISISDPYFSSAHVCRIRNNFNAVQTLLGPRKYTARVPRYQ